MTESQTLPKAPARPASPKATQLVMVRHAEVETDYHRVFGGRIDMGLSDRGHQQARCLAEFLHSTRIDAVYTSPMKRVQQTLAPLQGNGTPRPVTVAELREVDFGAWTGLRWEAVQERFGVSPFTWLDQLEANAIPEAESGAQLRARLEPCLNDILRQHSGQVVVLACHGGVIRMLLSILLRLPLSRMSMFEIEYASVTRVACQPAEACVHLLNFTPWHGRLS